MGNHYLSRITILLSSPPPSTADAAWADVINFLMPWVTRAGIAVIFIGVIIFALAIKDDNPSSKQSGILTMVSGGIVAAAGAFAQSFLI